MQNKSSHNAYLLGIDVGTTVSKSVVYNLDGQEVAVARYPTATQHPMPSASEANMLDIWQAVRNTIHELIVEQSIAAEAIKAVGISATVAGVWLLDQHKAPFRNAILWNDGRATSLLSKWEAEGIIQEIFNISGNAAFPGMTLPSLRWLMENEPETLKTARYLICAKDWIRFNLTGDIHTDETDLSQILGDIRNRGYSDDLFRLCGVDDYVHLFPRPVLSQTVVGTVTSAAAKQTGLKEGTPVVAGLTDVQASMIGAGATQVESACSIVGTSSLNNIVLDRPSFEPAGVGFQFLMPENLWVRSFANTSGTMILDWFIKNFTQAERAEAKRLGISIYEVLEESAASVPIGADGIIFHPYLNTTGVAAPFRNAAARAQFFGISVQHERRHLLRAVYEGLALAMRELYLLAPVPIEEIIITGGGARSPFWCQMFADCTGHRMIVPEGTEFGTKGDAILAGIGTGIYKDLKTATLKTFRIARVYDPDPEKTEKYEQVYLTFRG